MVSQWGVLGTEVINLLPKKRGNVKRLDVTLTTHSLLGISGEGAVWPTFVLLIWLKTRQALELPFISRGGGGHLPRLCGASDTISTWQQRPSCPKSEDSSEETLDALEEGQKMSENAMFAGKAMNKSTLPHKQACSLPISFFHPGGYKGSQGRILCVKRLLSAQALAACFHLLGSERCIRMQELSG